MKKNRLVEIDGLRGIAALTVLIFHYFFLYDQLYQHDFDVPEIIRFGQYGVHLFFMISGFVIYWTISKSDTPRDFLWSRFSRLFPVFWVAVISTFIIVSTFGLPGRETNSIEFLLNLTMLHDFAGISHVDGVYWTLTLELAFYFWMYLFMQFNLLKHLDKILFLWVALAGAISYRKFGIDLLPIFEKLFLIHYVELFALGICLFKIKNQKHTLLTYYVVCLAILSLFAKYHNFLAIGLSVSCLVFYLAATNRLRLLAFSPLVYLGTVSYALYLTHQNIGYVSLNYMHQNGISSYISLPTTIFLSLVIATLLTKYVEKPSLKFLRSYYSSLKLKVSSAEGNS